MGLVVISYTIKDINDQSGYLKAYGAKAIAEVKRDERIKTAEAEARSRIKGYEAEMAKEKSRLENQLAIAEQQRNYDLRNAENEMAIKSASAIEDAAQQIKTAQKQIEVTNAKMKTKIIERQKQIELQEQENSRYLVVAEEHKL